MYALTAAVPFGFLVAFGAVLTYLHATGELSSEWAQDSFGFLYMSYTDGHWYFELLELVRKLLLTSVAAFVYAGSATQILSATLLSVFAMGLVLSVRPFRVESDVWVAAYAHFQIVLLFSLGQMILVS